MTQASPETTVRNALTEFLSALATLADEIAAVEGGSGDGGEADVAGASRAVLVVSDALASALVDGLEELALEYGDLDEVLWSLAGRDEEIEDSAESVVELFRTLRKVSYDQVDVGRYPNVEDVAIVMERAINLVLEKWKRHAYE